MGAVKNNSPEVKRKYLRRWMLKTENMEGPSGFFVVYTVPPKVTDVSQKICSLETCPKCKYL